MNRTVEHIVHSMMIKEAGLQIKQPLPTTVLRDIDPFILLHHHGPMVCESNYAGLPFGPHPHRGFETVTIIYDGDIEHRDSLGTSSIINKGGIQWMTAGSGIIHSENVSESFRKQGGILEIIQLWINLPSAKKMIKPTYQGIQEHELPIIDINEHATMKLISGDINSVKGIVDSITNIFLSTITVKETTNFSLDIPDTSTILLYVRKGEITIDNQDIPEHALVHCNTIGDCLHIQAVKGTELLFGYGFPYHEPIIAHGPFVMNTVHEIHQAITDYHDGLMGEISIQS